MCTHRQASDSSYLHLIPRIPRTSQLAYLVPCSTLRPCIPSTLYLGVYIPADGGGVAEEACRALGAEHAHQLELDLALGCGGMGAGWRAGRWCVCGAWHSCTRGGGRTHNRVESERKKGDREREMLSTPSYDCNCNAQRKQTHGTI